MTTASEVTRTLDILLSAIGLLASAPLLLLAAIGIKATSPGPVLHRARRVGLGGRPFTMLKLRTMHLGSAAGGRITSSVDPRVFAWGGALRRSKVDELPQLVNVLKGDMSLVGPRPEDVSIVRDHYTPFMRESLAVRPGVTGPGSLNYFAIERGLPDDPAAAEVQYLRHLLPRKIALDLVFVRNRSTRYYLGLVFRTFLGLVGLGRIFAQRAKWEQSTAASYLATQVRPFPGGHDD